MSESVAFRASSANSVVLHFLSSSVGVLATGCFRGFLGNDIDELLLRLDEVFHALASQIDECSG